MKHVFCRVRASDALINAPKQCRYSSRCTASLSGQLNLACSGCVRVQIPKEDAVQGVSVRACRLGFGIESAD